MTVSLLPHMSTSSPQVTLCANLAAPTPTGHVLLDSDILTLHEARRLAEQLAHAVARLDALIAANGGEQRAA